MTAWVQLFGSGFLLSLSLCLDLGVVNLAAVRAGLTRGTQAALMLGLGSCVGDLLYALGSLSLVTVLLAHRGARIALWLGGSAVLSWLAVKMLKESRRPKELAPGTQTAGGEGTMGAGAAAQGSSSSRDFARGVMLALSSPSAILWFAAVGGSVIAAHARDRSALLPFLAGFLVAGVCWSLAVALLTGYAHRRMSGGLIRGLALASALLFAYFAAVVFVRGYREFVEHAQMQGLHRPDIRDADASAPGAKQVYGATTATKPCPT